MIVFFCSLAVIPAPLIPAFNDHSWNASYSAPPISNWASNSRIIPNLILAGDQYVKLTRNGMDARDIVQYGNMATQRVSCSDQNHQCDKNVLDCFLFIHIIDFALLIKSNTRLTVLIHSLTIRFSDRPLAGSKPSGDLAARVIRIK